MTKEDYNLLREEIGYFYWYWKNKAKYVKKFTGLDIVRFLTYNVDDSDREMVKKFLLSDYNLPSLFGVEGEDVSPGTYKYTTWELLAKTMQWQGEVWEDVYAFTHHLPMIHSINHHIDAMETLYNAWLAHYYRMFHKDDIEMALDDFYPYPSELEEIPWWSI